MLRDANGHQFCRFEEQRDHARERARLCVADAWSSLSSGKQSLTTATHYPTPWALNSPTLSLSSASKSLYSLSLCYLSTFAGEEALVPRLFLNPNSLRSTPLRTVWRRSRAAFGGSVKNRVKPHSTLGFCVGGRSQSTSRKLWLDVWFWTIGFGEPLECARRFGVSVGGFRVSVKMRSFAMMLLLLVHSLASFPLCFGMS